MKKRTPKKNIGKGWYVVSISFLHTHSHTCVCMRVRPSSRTRGALCGGERAVYSLVSATTKIALFLEGRREREERDTLRMHYDPNALSSKIAGTSSLTRRVVRITLMSIRKSPVGPGPPMFRSRRSRSRILPPLSRRRRRESLKPREATPLTSHTRL